MMRLVVLLTFFCLILKASGHTKALAANESEEIGKDVEDDNEEEEYVSAEEEIDDSFHYPEHGEIPLPKEYDKFRIPSPNVDVFVQLTITSIGNIDEMKEQIEVELNVLLSWIDYAILEQNKTNCNREWTSMFTLNPEFSNKIWLPDLFIDNVAEISSKNILNKPTRLLMANNGEIRYSTKASVTLNCPLNFLFYPSDTQTCNVLLSSYSYRSYQMSLSWLHPGVFYSGAPNSDYNRGIGNLQKIKIRSDFYGQGVRPDERFDGLTFQIKLRRHIAYHLTSIYLPSMLFVGIVWISYLVPLCDRISIVMTILLTLTSMFAVVSQNIPVANYVKAIDIWMFAGIFYVFFTLCVFSILIWVETQENKPAAGIRTQGVTEEKVSATTQEACGHIQCNDKAEDIESNSTAGTKKAYHVRFIQLRQGYGKRIIKYVVLVAEFVEANSFILHLVIFGLFNAMYWSWLLIGSKYYTWKVDFWGNFDE